MKKPNEKALSFSYAFLGVRLQCAECHKHPFDQWSQYDFQHFTAFFNRVEYSIANDDKETSRKMRQEAGVDKKGIGVGERNKLMLAALKNGATIPFEEVFIEPPPKSRSGSSKKGERVDASRVITPKVLGGDEVVDDSYDDPRQPLMDWLRQKDNPYFARAIVNRVWANYFNVGIVDPPDDMNLANAPSNKELLDWLAQAFIENGYDLKWLHRQIAGSRTYQLSWKTNATNEFDLKNFSHSVPRRLPAEVVLDAVVSATSGDKELAERREHPDTECAIGLTRGYSRRGSAGDYALSVFGKPKRETPCDCERSNEPSLLQTVYLRNDSDMFQLIDREKGWLKTTMKQLTESSSADLTEDERRVEKFPAIIKEIERKISSSNDSKNIERWGRELKERKLALHAAEERIAEVTKTREDAIAVHMPKLVREVYLRTFSREPNKTELAQAQQYIADSESPVDGLRDLIWALANSKEFVVNH
jgi:hypothetical protein